MADVVRDVLRSLHRGVLDELHLARSVQHPGEDGRAREQVLAAFFARLLPAAYSISTGFVIDALGGISRQIDLVIYRNDYAPVIEVSGVKHFLIESVAAVMEVKARIRSKPVLLEALENIASVKALDRTNRGQNREVHGTIQGRFIEPDHFNHQVFGAIVTAESVGERRLEQELLTYLRRTEKRRWPNLYIDVHRQAVTYRKATYGPTEPSMVTVVPDQASHVTFQSLNDAREHPPLLYLAFELLNFLRVVPTIDFNPVDYFAMGPGVRGDSAALPQIGVATPAGTVPGVTAEWELSTEMGGEFVLHIATHGFLPGQAVNIYLYPGCIHLGSGMQSGGFIGQPGDPVQLSPRFVLPPGLYGVRAVSADHLYAAETTFVVNPCPADQPPVQ